MKIRQMMIVSNTDRELLMQELNATMRDLAEKNPEVKMADATTFYVFYDEWAAPTYLDLEEEECENAIKFELDDDLPLCNDCPHFQAPVNTRILWGKCDAMGNAACGGKGKKICQLRIKELKERKEVERAENEQHDCKRSDAV